LIFFSSSKPTPQIRPVKNSFPTEEIFVLFGMLKCKGKGKGKAIPLEAWTGPEGSRRMRFRDFKTISI